MDDGVGERRAAAPGRRAGARGPATDGEREVGFVGFGWWLPFRRLCDRLTVGDCIVFLGTSYPYTTYKWLRGVGHS